METIQRIALTEEGCKQVSVMLKNGRTLITTNMMIQSVCFAICFFVFQLAEFTMNDRASVILGPGAVNYIYSLGLLCSSGGLYSFYLLRSFVRNEFGRKVVTLAVGASCILCAIVMLLSNESVSFLIAGFLLLYSIGIMGGNFYYTFSIELMQKECSARLLGVGMGAAVLLQYGVQNVLDTQIVFFCSVGFSVVFLIYFALKKPRDWMLEDPLPYASGPVVDRKHVMMLILAVVFMSCVLGFIDGVVVSRHARGYIDVSSYPRLCYSLSLVLAGFVADFRKGKYFSIVTVCILFASTVSSALIGSARTACMAMCIMYFYAGFYVMFLTLYFIRLAPCMKNPTFWAPFGRVLRCIVAAIITVPVAYIYESHEDTLLIIGTCLFSVFTLVVLLPEIGQSLMKGREENLQEEKLDQRESYFRAHAFTPREIDVFEQLIFTEKNNQEIADDLFISRRVLQRYISSIYEKTNTRTRIGLVQQYIHFVENK